MIDRAIARAYSALMRGNAKTATAYLSPSLVVRVTRQGVIYPRASRVTVLVTVGAPNYLARRMIRDLKRCGYSFPVRQPILSGRSKRYSRKRGA